VWLAAKRFGSLAVVGKCGRVEAAEQRSIARQFDGRERQDERGLWVECHTKEFCMKVLKFEIVNSRKVFNYFSEVVLRTIESSR
jgi:hypothetical protein